MSLYEIFSEGNGEVAGTVCNNPYTTYGFAGGMYENPITGANGNILYTPSGEKGLNSNSTDNFTNETFYKYISTAGGGKQSIVDPDNKDSIALPKSVFTNLKLVNQTMTEFKEIKAESKEEAILRAAVYAKAIQFRYNSNWIGKFTSTFYQVTFDEDDIIEKRATITPKAEAKSRDDLSENSYLVPFLIRQCPCYDKSVDDSNSESNFLLGEEEVASAGSSEADLSNEDTSITKTFETWKAGIETYPVKGIVMGTQYNFKVVKRSIPSNESDFTLADTNSNNRTCVTGNYKVDIPCPRIDSYTKGGFKKGKGFTTIDDVRTKPEDALRYMLIY